MFVCKALEFSMILVYVHSLVPLEYTSPLIGAWKCNLPPFQEIMTDQLTNQPMDMRGHREFTLPLSSIIATGCSLDIVFFP